MDRGVRCGGWRFRLGAVPRRARADARVVARVELVLRRGRLRARDLARRSRARSPLVVVPGLAAACRRSGRPARRRRARRGDGGGCGRARGAGRRRHGREHGRLDGLGESCIPARRRVAARRAHRRAGVPGLPAAPPGGRGWCGARHDTGRDRLRARASGQSQRYDVLYRERRTGGRVAGVRLLFTGRDAARVGSALRLEYDARARLRGPGERLRLSLAGDHVPCRRAPLDRWGRVRAGGRARDHAGDARRNGRARSLEPDLPECGASGMSGVGVVGAGAVGSGVAHVFAEHGWDPVLIGVAPGFLERALATIRANFGRQVKKGTVTAERRDAALARIRVSSGLDAVKDVELVVEAATEQETKFKIFRELDRLAPPAAVLASNTSSISITTLAAQTKRPGQVIGMHFMNPVPVMQLVEVVRGMETADETVVKVVEVVEALHKIPVVVNDSPGFVSNRVLMPMINEAVYCVMEGVAAPDAVDQIMKLGMNHPVGPLALADLIGLDVCLHILDILHHDFGDPKYRPAPLLRQMVAAGRPGRETRRGLFVYLDLGRPPLPHAA